MNKSMMLITSGNSLIAGVAIPRQDMQPLQHAYIKADSSLHSSALPAFEDFCRTAGLLLRVELPACLTIAAVC